MGLQPEDDFDMFDMLYEKMRAPLAAAMKAKTKRRRKKGKSKEAAR